jgi:spore coat protein U-like protein
MPMTSRWSSGVGLALLALSFGAIPAAAQSCSASASTIDFGSLDVLPGTSMQTAGTLDVSCSGTPNDTIRVCVNMGGATIGGRRYMTSAASSSDLFYDLFQDSGLSVPWGSYANGGTGVQIDLTLNGSGQGSASRPVYAGLYPGQQTAGVGNYTAAFAGTTANITYTQGTTLSCSGIGTNETPVNFTAQATVAANCNVSASALDFGSLSTLDQPRTGTASVSVQCSANAPYTVGLDGGLSQAADPTRRLLTSQAGTIGYALYRDAAHQSPWGDSTGTMNAGTGTAASQVYPVFGVVPVQPAPAVGTYKDTVVVAVTF